MKIKLKGVCVDINKPRSKEALVSLLNVCKAEVNRSKQPRKAFIKMFIKVIDKKLKKEYYPINQINNYEEKNIKLA